MPSLIASHRRIFLVLGFPLAIIFFVSFALGNTQELHKTNLPLILSNASDIPPNPAIPQDRVCQAGWHIVHKATGTPGLQLEEPLSYGEDEEGAYQPLPYSDDDYVCVVNQTVDDITCENGTAVVVNGVALCACDEGYGGQTCAQCAQGFNAEDNMCVMGDIPTELRVEGLADSFVPGETRPLTPTHAIATNFNWTIEEGDACFVTSFGCMPTFDGPTAIIQMLDRPINEMALVRFSIESTEPSGFPPYKWQANTLVMPGDQIPVSGHGDHRLLPIVDHLRTYMRHRCIGAATLGISRDGVILGNWALGRMDGPAAGKDVWDPACGDPMLEVHELAPKVPVDTPFLIGSVSKYHTSAVLRWAINAVAQQEGGITLTDQQILGLRPFDPNNYPPLIPGTNQPFPVPLVPQDVYDLMSGKVPYPVGVPDAERFGRTANSGFGLCGNLNGFADPQWQNVTIGHIISHRTGLQGSSPNYADDIVPNLPTLRGLTTQQHFIDQEALLRAQWGNTKVNAAKSNLGISLDGYLLPRPEPSEFLQMLAGRCLRFPLGTERYSNTSPFISQTIITHLMASKRFVGSLENPANHTGSALHSFLQTIGIPSTASTGIFAYNHGQVIPGYDIPGPAFRHWNATENSYYPLVWDIKQPHCTWNNTNTSCLFTGWRNGSRARWDMVVGRTDIVNQYADVSPGTGSFMVQTSAEMQFLAAVRIGRYSTPAASSTVGQLRAGQPNVHYGHGGSMDGVRAFANQLSSSTSTTLFTLPPLAQGKLTDDYLNTEEFTCSVSMPDGVDFFVTVNQRSDKKCAEQIVCDENEENCRNICGSAYGMLQDVVRYGICQVNWDAIPTVIPPLVPINQLQLGP